MPASHQEFRVTIIYELLKFHGGDGYSLRIRPIQEQIGQALGIDRAEARHHVAAL